jgi:Family of unknown function (DUF5670)
MNRNAGHRLVTASPMLDLRDPRSCSSSSLNLNVKVIRSRLGYPDACSSALCTCAQPHRTCVSDCLMLEYAALVDRLRSCVGRARGPLTRKGAMTMLYTIAVIFLVAWLLGIIGMYTIGAFVHVLLVVAVALFVVGLLSGRRSMA